MNRRRRFALTLNLFAAALLAAALLSGCSDNGTEPEAPAQDTTSQADLLEDMLPATSLIEEGLFADPTETALAGTAPGSEQAVSSPI